MPSHKQDVLGVIVQPKGTDERDVLVGLAYTVRAEPRDGGAVYIADSVPRTVRKPVDSWWVVSIEV